ncbi:FkbM family methyltransferase [Paenibacillus oenotherae]|uniref:FkbM family methyltransferase n=1 Tax=Paenibacillus oenotherae TaxID=1435645 RepID=A0ABS7DD41_9BACL|nr:FkbM family methyltransferase [Paenibacillus oenotherae]MBW7477654.1 FkbM family methyltransferase [Paenibacillus oenotherae]
MNSIYIGGNRILSLTGCGHKLILPSADLSITPEIVINGGIEWPLTRFLLREVKQGHRVVDIGANVGYFAVLCGYLIGPSGKLWAYEPHPELYPFLMDNLSINYLHDRTEVRPLAVYSAAGSLVFQAAQRFMGNSSVHRHGDAYHKHYRDHIVELSVEAVALDDNADELGTVDYMKMDIEGGEYRALLGMDGMIRNGIRHLIFEVNRTMLADDWMPFCELLRKYEADYGKQFSLLTEEGVPVPTTADDLIESGSQPFVLMKARAES